MPMSVYIFMRKTLQKAKYLQKSGDLLHSYHVEITITFSYGRQNKKVVFKVADDKYTSSSGVNIITTYID